MGQSRPDASDVHTASFDSVDYAIRQDGDYLYVVWTNMPPELRSGGGFIRSELKRQADGTWRGKTRSLLPGYKTESGILTNWCQGETNIQINLLSNKRIEGVAIGFKKYDFQKCKATGEAQQPFTWIPK